MKKQWIVFFFLLAAAFLFGCQTDSQKEGEGPENLLVPRETQREVQVEAPAPVENPVVWGTPEDMTFHRRECPRLKGVDESKLKKFKSVYLALDADFHPCKECEPLK